MTSTFTPHTMIIHVTWLQSFTPHSVQKHKAENRMDSKNLAVVFTPSLMRSPYNTNEIIAVQKLPEQKKAIDLLIQNYDSLFS